MLANLTLIDWIGVLGSFTIAAAYLAVSRNWVEATRPAFNIINLTGALMILLSLWYRPNPGAITMELLWVAIALAALLRYFFNPK